MRLRVYTILFFLFYASSSAAAVSFPLASTSTVSGETAGTSSSTVVDIYADEMSFSRTENRISAKGNVRIFYNDIEMEADIVDYDREYRVIHASGSIKFRKTGYSITSDEMVYSLLYSTGRVYYAYVEAPPLYVKADEISLEGKDEFFIPSGQITTCNHDPPHYSFHGKKIRVKLGSKFSAYSMLLFIRGMPSFFYPYYEKSLGPRKTQFGFNAGSSSRDGNFVKTKLSYPFTENSRSYAGLDLMSKRGPGFSAGHSYRTANGYSNIDGYYIREKGTGEQLGRLYLNGWQEITQRLSARYRTEYSSDFQFNYDYGQATPEYKKQELYYQLGFDYSMRRYLLSLYGDKREVWTGEDYRIANMIVPGVRAQLFPVTVPGRISLTADTRYENQYEPETRDWQSVFKWESKIEKTYRYNMSRMMYLSFTPGLGYDGVYISRLDHYNNMYMSMKQGLMNTIFFTQDYHWRRAIKSPYIITDSMLDYRVRYRPVSAFEATTRSSYDFRKDEDEPVGDFFSTAELYLEPYRFYVRNRYDYYAAESREWLYEIEIGRYSATRIKYNYNFPGRLELDQTFRVFPGSNIFEFGVRFYLEKTARLYSFDEVIEKRASVKWDLHCWESEMRFLNRGKENEFWILFNIKAFPDTQVGLYGNLLYDDYRYVRQ